MFIIFIKGLQLVNSRIDAYSDAALVQEYTTGSNDETAVLLKLVARKVMLYSHNENGKFMVVDYQRPDVKLVCSEVLIP